MAKSKSQQEILVCGFPPALRLESILPRIGGGLRLRPAHTKGELLQAIALGRHGVCVMEHQVLDADPMNDLAGFFDGDPDGDAIIKALTSKRQVISPRSIPAYELLPELIAASPQTQFVITSHTRGFGFSPQERVLYSKHPEVVKLMGFVNADQNTNYLLRLFSRVYFGKTWKSKPDA
jgi:hypothetical protein